MAKVYTVFDVETPNSKNDRISSIGLTRIVDERIIDTVNYYVNPECHFDEFNVQLTGIAPADVAQAPAFPVIWANIRNLFFEGIVVAHNAAFDFSVLRKTLAAYGIEEDTEILYLDTLKMARDMFPCARNHRLNTLCDSLGITLECHHNSGSDCNATAMLLLTMLERGAYEDEYLQGGCLCQSSSNCGCTGRSKRLSNTSRSLLELEDVLRCITEDGKVEMGEFVVLASWIRQHDELMGQYPYDAIYSLLLKILDDGRVDGDELVQLQALCKQLLDPVHECKASTVEAVTVCGMNVVLSGEFCEGSKAYIANLLTEKGAIIQKSVTQKTNIVLVGDKGNSEWVAGNYGTKIKKAMELQEKGIQIKIVLEKDYFQH